MERKIVQIVANEMDVESGLWRLLGLGSDGVVYSATETGWEVFRPALVPVFPRRHDEAAKIQREEAEAWMRDACAWICEAFGWFLDQGRNIPEEFDGASALIDRCPARPKEGGAE